MKAAKSKSRRAEQLNEIQVMMQLTRDAALGLAQDIIKTAEDEPYVTLTIANQQGEYTIDVL
jgi:hypothetical protein